MRLLTVFLFIVLIPPLHAQIPVPIGGGLFPYQSNQSPRFPATDSLLHSKWHFSRYTAIGSGYLFTKGGHAFQLSVPVGLQVTRKLSPRLYAFANAAIAPTYTAFNRTFLAIDPAKNSSGYPWQRNAAYTGLYPSLALGLQYVNEEKTFSVSGSVRIERSNYSGMLPYGDLPAVVAPARRSVAH